jgi:hypothetical protein
MEQLGSKWSDFQENQCLGTFLNSVEKTHDSLNSDKISILVLVFVSE